MDSAFLVELFHEYIEVFFRSQLIFAEFGESAVAVSKLPAAPGADFHRTPKAVEFTVADRTGGTELLIEIGRHINRKGIERFVFFERFFSAALQKGKDIFIPDAILVFAEKYCSFLAGDIEIGVDKG